MESQRRQATGASEIAHRAIAEPERERARWRSGLAGFRFSRLWFSGTSLIRRKLLITRRCFSEGGVSAIEDMAHQILRIQALKDWDAGSTINAGLIDGGSTHNTIPAEANAVIDVRVKNSEEGQWITNAVHKLEPVDPASHAGGDRNAAPPVDGARRIGRLAVQARSNDRRRAGAV